MALARDEAPARGRQIGTRVREYGAACVLAALALVTRITLPGQESLTFSLLVLAVLLAGSYGGYGPGVLSAVLAAGGLGFLEAFTSAQDVVRLAGFVAAVSVAAI